MLKFYPDDIAIQGVTVRMRELTTDPDFVAACAAAGVSVYEGACRFCIAYQECCERDVDQRQFHRHFATYLALPKLYEHLRADGYFVEDDDGDQWVAIGDLVAPGLDLPDYYFSPAMGAS